MRIAGHLIGAAPFTIAECSINHNGSLAHAMQMIRVAAACGVTAVKFQTFKAEDVCDEEQLYTYRSQGEIVTERRIELFRRCELPEEAWPLLKAECERNNVIFLSTPETPADLDILLKVGIPAIKIGSDNLTNLPMLKYCSAPDVGLPIILSVGMSTWEEIVAAVKPMSQVVLLACTSRYPCPANEVNILRVDRLRIFWCPEAPTFEDAYTPIGFSDHTVGVTAAAMAVALGACVFEKHFTLDHDLPGPEHEWAANPQELAQWVSAINEAWRMRGDGSLRPSPAELENKASYQRKIP